VRTSEKQNTLRFLSEIPCMQLFAFCSTAMRMTSWYKHQLSVQQNKTKQEKIYEKKELKKSI